MLGALLLASVAAVPAMAQDQPNGGGWHREGGDRGGNQASNPGGDRGGHGGQGNGGNRGGGWQGGNAPQARPSNPQQMPQQAPRPDGQRPDRPQGGPGGFQPRGDAPDRPDGGRRVYGRPDNGVQVWRNDHGNAPRPDWSNRPNDRPGGFDRDHNGRPDWQDADRGRPGYGDRGGWNGRGGWNSGWRSDRRYDWQGWRSAHRDYYRVDRYRPPYGYRWGYRRWGIGVRIDPVFFGQDYWISDPDYYRLPPAYGNYRWVRYYNDALLVDVYSGMVVDEIPDFFW